MSVQNGHTNRRGFLGAIAAAGVGAQALATSGSVRAAANATARAGQPWPDMQFRTLGRTGHNASRLIFGCGAALSRKRQDALVETALEQGVNTLDIGTGRYYSDAERNLAPVLKKHRDDVYLISKAMTYLDVDPNDEVTAAQAREAAGTWRKILDESLRDLQVDYVDAYYVMAANNPHLLRSEEMRRTFEAARDAGLVRHWGLSTHQNAHAVLEAAIETGWYDLAMLAMTPKGWYDWESKEVMPNSPRLPELRPLLRRASEAGIGLIAMKAGRALAGSSWFGWGDPTLFDDQYPDGFRQATDISAFQKSYAYVLENGFDAVNADIQNQAILAENFDAAALSSRWLA